MLSVCNPAKSLPQTVFINRCPDGFFEHFRRGHFVVLDGIEWDGMDELRAGLVPRARKFGTAFGFNGLPPGGDLMAAQATSLVEQMFPPCDLEEVVYRPMITGPEPMHFDTYPAPVSVLTAFINISPTPRVYRIGPTFAQLVQDHPNDIRDIAKRTGWTDISYMLRTRTMDGKPPMPAGCDAHEVELAPGAIWFFNGKTASHEVVYGEGALSIAWTLPGDVPTQEDMMRHLRD